MPHEGYVDPVTNDGPRCHSNTPVSELTERVTRAIEASDISSTPLVAETANGVTHETRPTPTEPYGAWGLGHPTPTWESSRPHRLRSERTLANTPTGRNTGVYGPRKEY